MHSLPLALITAFALSASTAAQSPYRVGQPLPALRLPEVGGQRTVDLADFRGRKLVLSEFASW